MRNESSAIVSKFMDLRFILATSNNCERLLSKAGYTLGSRSKAIGPQNFESQLYLLVNREYRNIADVNSPC